MNWDRVSNMAWNAYTEQGVHAYPEKKPLDKPKPDHQRPTYRNRQGELRGIGDYGETVQP